MLCVIHMHKWVGLEVSLHPRAHHPNLLHEPVHAGPPPACSAHLGGLSLSDLAPRPWKEGPASLTYSKS